MSARIVIPNSEATVPVVDRRALRILLFDVLHIAGSTRLGVALLTTLGAACLAGMLVMQQNVDGFSNYFAALTPAQRQIYGTLGLFDVYHSCWFMSADLP